MITLELYFRSQKSIDAGVSRLAEVIEQRKAQGFYLPGAVRTGSLWVKARCPDRPDVPKIVFSLCRFVAGVEKLIQEINVYGRALTPGFRACELAHEDGRFQLAAVIFGGRDSIVKRKAMMLSVSDPQCLRPALFILQRNLSMILEEKQPAKVLAAV